MFTDLDNFLHSPVWGIPKSNATNAHEQDDVSNDIIENGTIEENGNDNVIGVIGIKSRWSFLSQDDLKMK